MKPKVATPSVTYSSSLSFLLSRLHIPGNVLLTRKGMKYELHFKIGAGARQPIRYNLLNISI